MSIMDYRQWTTRLSSRGRRPRDPWRAGRIPRCARDDSESKGRIFLPGAGVRAGWQELHKALARLQRTAATLLGRWWQKFLPGRLRRPDRRLRRSYQRGDAGQGLAFHPFEEGAAGGRDVGELVLDARCCECGDGVAAARD